MNKTFPDLILTKNSRKYEVNSSVRYKNKFDFYVSVITRYKLFDYILETQNETKRNKWPHPEVGNLFSLLQKTSPSIWVFTVFLYMSISLTILPTLSKKIKYCFPLSSIQICFNY